MTTVQQEVSCPWVKLWHYIISI